MEQYKQYKRLLDKRLRDYDYTPPYPYPLPQPTYYPPCAPPYLTGTPTWTTTTGTWSGTETTSGTTTQYVRVPGSLTFKGIPIRCDPAMRKDAVLLFNLGKAYGEQKI